MNDADMTTTKCQWRYATASQTKSGSINWFCVHLFSASIFIISPSPVLLSVGASMLSMFFPFHVPVLTNHCLSESECYPNFLFKIFFLITSKIQTQICFFLVFFCSLTIFSFNKPLWNVLAPISIFVLHWYLSPIPVVNAHEMFKMKQQNFTSNYSKWRKTRIDCLCHDIF